MSITESDFIFDSVQLKQYKRNKVSFKRGGLYIDSSDQIKNKKTAINPKNEDDKCFQYAAIVILYYKEIEHIQTEFQILNSL